MKSPRRHLVEKLFPKRFEVWSIAETSRADGYQLSELTKKFDSEREESCVEIRGLNARFSQQPSGARVAADFSVRGIENGGVKWCLGRAEQIAAHEGDCVLNEISGMQFG